MGDNDEDNIDNNDDAEDNIDNNDDNMEEMFEAIENDDLSEVKKLLPLIDINEAFIVASSFGNIDIMMYLHSQGADPSAQDNKALIEAVDGGYIDAVKWLISQGVQDYNNQAITIANQTGKTDIVDYLLNNGGSKPIVQNDNQKIKLAIQQEDINTLSTLKTKIGIGTITKLAAEGGKLNVVKWLVSQGVSPDTIMVYAIRKKRKKIIKWLLSHGADINETLILAAMKGMLKLVKRLVSKGADIAFRDNDPLITAASENRLEVLKWLVSQGADPFAQDNSAIGMAMQRGHTDIIDYLVSLGAPVNECITSSWTEKEKFFNNDINETFMYYDIQNKYDDVSEISGSIPFGEKCRIINEYSPSEEWKEKMLNYVNDLSEGEKSILNAYTYVGDRIINIYFREGADATLKEIKKRNFTPFLFVMVDILKDVRHRTKSMKTSDSRSLYIPTKNGRKMVLNENIFADEGITLNDLNKEGVETVLEIIFFKLKEYEVQDAKDREKNDLLNYFSDDFIRYSVEYAIHTMVRIFLDAPRLDKDILVFRGNKEDFFSHEKSFKSLGVLSTTNNPIKAIEFGEYLWRIYVSKGTRCIPMFDSNFKEESEIIFPHGTILQLEGCDTMQNNTICEIELRENIEKINI